MRLPVLIFGLMIGFSANAVRQGDVGFESDAKDSTGTAETYGIVENCDKGCLDAFHFQGNLNEQTTFNDSVQEQTANYIGENEDNSGTENAR